MRTTLATRPLTLRVPIANEGERAHFQRRLALTAFLIFALAGGFFAISLLSVVILVPGHARYLFVELSSQIHLAMTSIAGVVWLLVRRGKPSARLLSALDVVLSTGICAGWSAMAVSGIPLVQRPHMIALLACTYTLVVRASLIPSTPARTAVLGALSLAPLVPMTSRLYPVVAPAAQDWGLPPWVDAAIWAMLGVAATTVISHIIYGLRQEVRKAMQLGQYVLEEKIGEGGMGVVYRASHAMLRRPTAIKLLNADAAQAAERFEREVQITARLTHPNTVAVFDYGRTPDGIFYYAMEYLDGISLEDLVAAHGPQPPRRVAHVIVQMCGALQEAHEAGLVHRDIKPANAMLTKRGGVLDVVKVLDFGLVKEGGAAAAGPAVSMVNAILGTPHYMAPESILDPSKVDGRADLYAVGATAYFLLTGENVFDGTNLIEVCTKHLHDAPSPPSTKNPAVPPALERAILQCLAKKPADRPADAATLAEIVRACDLGEWTQRDAEAWWADHGGVDAVPKASHPPHSTEVSAFGKTVAVALDDRSRTRERAAQG